MATTGHVSGWVKPVVPGLSVYAGFLSPFPLLVTLCGLRLVWRQMALTVLVVLWAMYFFLWCGCSG